MWPNSLFCRYLPGQEIRKREAWKSTGWPAVIDQQPHSPIGRYRQVATADSVAQRQRDLGPSDAEIGGGARSEEGRK